MKVIFTGRHVEVTEALRLFAQERLDKMATYLDDVIDTHVILSVEKHRHLAEVTLKTRKDDFVASAETDDMYQSLSQALDKLETQAHKHAGKRHDTVFVAGNKIAMFVKNIVVGQTLLAVSGGSPPAAQQGRRVIAVPVLQQRMTDNHIDIRQRTRQGIQLAFARGVKVLAKQEIFRRIAAQHEFRREQDIGTARLGATREIEDFRRVTGNIPDRGVNLGDGNFEHRHNYKRYRAESKRRPICHHRGFAGSLHTDNKSPRKGNSLVPSVTDKIRADQSTRSRLNHQGNNTCI